LVDWLAVKTQFQRFADHVSIPSKDEGIVRMRAWSSQLYLDDEIFAGLEAGYHDFIVLKARQLGISSRMWALDLFWLVTFSGVQGMYIADDENNKDLHRDIVSQMYLSLPRGLSRGPWRTNNRLELTWADQANWRASRLVWAFANRRNEGQLGRSRGINFLHGTEMDSWRDEEGVAALSASLSDRFPHRLYVWEGTGQNFQLLYQM